MSRSYLNSALATTNLVEAAEVIANESTMYTVPSLAADTLLGTTLAPLDGLDFSRGVRAWQLSARPDLTLTRLRRENRDRFDLLEALWSGTSAPIQLRLAGPWTLVSALELPNGHRAIVDAGARREIGAALMHSASLLASDVKKRFQTAVEVTFVEPALGPLLRGALPGTSDFETIPTLHPEDAGKGLHQLLSNCNGFDAIHLDISQPWQDDSLLAPLAQVARLAAVTSVHCELTTLTQAPTAGVDAWGDLLGEDACGVSVPLTTPGIAPDSSGENVMAQVARLVQVRDLLQLDSEWLGRKVSVTPTEATAEAPLVATSRALAMATQIAHRLETSSADM